MPTDVLWSAALSAGLTLVAWILKNYADEQARLQILLNRTREEMAKEYVTKAEVHADINRVITRIDHLDQKIDSLLRSLTK